MNIIYKITNPIGNIYIGATNNQSSRFNRYKNLHCRNQKLLYKSLKHYGFSNHIIKILEEVSKEELETKEIYYIKELNSYYKENPLGLNLTRGGKGERPKGWIPSQETRDKWRVANTGKIWSEERKELFAASKKDWKPSDKMINLTIEACSKPVIQYDLSDNPVQEWKSITEIVNTLKYGKKYISLCCNNKQETYKNHIWKFKN